MPLKTPLFSQPIEAKNQLVILLIGTETPSTAQTEKSQTAF